MIMEMLSLILGFVCVIIVAFSSFKNHKLVVETEEARQEYKNVKSINMQLNETVVNFSKLNSSLISDISDLKAFTHKQSKVIDTQYLEIKSLRGDINLLYNELDVLNGRVESLEYDNKRLKQKVKLQEVIISRENNVLSLKKQV